MIVDQTPTSHHRTGAMPTLTYERQSAAPACHRSTPQDLNASAPAKRDEGRSQGRLQFVHQLTAHLP
jgi:hypothetical protein